jgi:hypothetical protein
MNGPGVPEGHSNGGPVWLGAAFIIAMCVAAVLGVR